MKRISVIALVGICLLAGIAYGAAKIYNNVQAHSITLGPDDLGVTFACLSSSASPCTDSKSTPPQTSGTQAFCRDCSATTTCTGGGSGVWAYRQAGAWSCAQATSSVVGLTNPMVADLDANGHSIFNVDDLLAYAVTPYANNATDALLGFSIDGTYNVVAYGADPTGAVDSVAAEQAANDDACKNAASPSGASVVWPQGKYLHSAAGGPLIIACNRSYSWRGKGVNASEMVNSGGNPNNGVSVVEYEQGRPALMDPITATSLVSGSGVALNWGPVNEAARHQFNLSQVWGKSVGPNQSNNPLSGSTAATIDGFIRFIPLTGDADGAVYGPFRMDNHLTSAAPTTKLVGLITYVAAGPSLFKICASTTGNPATYGSSSNVADPTKCITVNLPNNTTEYFQWNYDGSNLNMAIGVPGGTATWATPVASAGALINEMNDDFWLGRASTDPSQFMAGKLDSFRISNVIRNAQASGSFTAPSAKFTTDANTIVLLNTASTKSANPGGLGVLYPVAIKAEGFSSGWLVAYADQLPSSGGIASIDDMTVGPGVFVNESIANGKYTNVNFQSQWWGGYHGYNQAYNVAFTHAGFTDVRGIFKIRQDLNSFGYFKDINISSGYYQVVGTGGFDIDGALYQVGAGTIAENTFLGKGDLFTADRVVSFSGDAEEGGSAIPFVVGSSLSKLVIENSAFNPAGAGTDVIKFTGTPPNHVSIKDSAVLGIIRFDDFIGTTTPGGAQVGAGSEPVLLQNDYATTGQGLGKATTSICSKPNACQIVGANTQFSTLGIQVGPPTIVARSSQGGLSGTTTTVNRISNAQPGDMYITTLAQYNADPGAYTLPSGWFQETSGTCSVNDTTVIYVRTFWHVASQTDPSTWTFTWTNATNPNNYFTALVRGADQTTPIDRCFSSHANSTVSVAMTGGTSTNINDIVIDMPGFYTGTSVAAVVGASPPSDLVQIANNTGSAYAWWYTPASLTIPTVNYTLSATTQPWAGLQIAVRPKTQSSATLGTTATAGVMWQGMSGAQFQSASGTFNGIRSVTGPAYNAVGDCTATAATTACTNNHDAIQSAIDACYTQGCAVFFPPRVGSVLPTVYYTATPINPKGVSLIGPPGSGTRDSGGLYALVNLRGAASQDVLATLDPSTGGYVSPLTGFVIQDLGLIVNDSADASASFPDRKPGKTCADVVLTSASAVITSAAQCEFVPGDVGQAFTATDGTNTVTTTILSVQSLTSATMNTTWGFSTTSASSTAYVSVMGLGATASIGNCAFTYDNKSGSGGSHIVTASQFRNLTISTTSGADQNKVCGIFFQGNSQPYNTTFENVTDRTEYGMMFVPVDTVPGSAGAAGMGDLVTFKNVRIDAHYPFVAYNGGTNHIYDMEIGFAWYGPQLLRVNTSAEDYPNEWTLENYELESTGGGGSNGGARIDGIEMHVDVGSFSNSVNTPAQLDATASTFSNIVSSTSTINMTGRLNKLELIDLVDNTTVTDTGFGNQCSKWRFSAPLNSIEPARATACGVTTSRQQNVLTNTADFVASGNEATPYLNQQDLWIWPQDAYFSGGAATVTADATSETGTYFVIPSSGGKTLAGYDKTTPVVVGTHIPSTKVKVCIKAKSESGTPTMTVAVKATATTLLTLTPALSTSYSTTCGDADFSTHGTESATVVWNTPANNIDVAWVSMQPWRSSLRTTPTTFAGAGTCNAGAQGAQYFITDDNSACTFATNATGGGATPCRIGCDGTNWKAGY